jgi:probable phosphoglycerate mutase
MTTTFLLIRHALHEYGGDRIAGRTADIHLSPDGMAQAQRLAASLQSTELDAVYCSPLERTCETAMHIAAGRAISPTVAPELTELAFGDWARRELAELRSEEHWKQFNAFRSGTRAPEGELMIETQARIVGLMTTLRARHPGRRVALVSHGDVIRSALLYWLGSPIDMFMRLEIRCASISVVDLAEYGPYVRCVNALNFTPEVLSEL